MQGGDSEGNFFFFFNFNIFFIYKDFNSYNIYCPLISIYIHILWYMYGYLGDIFRKV